MQFAGPQLLKLLINYLKSEDPNINNGLLITLALFITSAVQSLALRNYFFINYRTGMKLRSAAITEVYRKTLRLSSEARAKYSAGEIANLVSVDSTRLQNLTPYMHTGNNTSLL